MRKFNQNKIGYREIPIGKDKKTSETIYKKIKWVSTDTKVMLYDSTEEEIGQAGCLRKQDFDFESLYWMALKKSASTISAVA